MLDIRSCSIKPYCFQDGEKVIETKNPTEGFYESLVKSRSSKEETLKVVEEVVDYMLKEPDKHYLNELSFDIKLVLMQDYLKYHTEQLGTRFPIPYLPSNKEENTGTVRYQIPYDLSDAHFCYLYSGIPIDRLMELDIYEYRVILLNAFVDQASKTKEGLEMLNRYASLEEHNTEFDTEGLLSLL